MSQLMYVKRGIKPRTWYVEISARTDTSYFVRQRMPKYVNRILGVRSFSGGVSPNNSAVIAIGALDDYFLQLVSVSGGFIFDKIRLDILNYTVINSDAVQSTDGDYFPMNEEGKNIDLPRSLIYNPGGASNAIMLGFLYI